MSKETLIRLFCIVIIALSISLSAEQATPTKQELWDAMSEEVNHWGDGLGYPIDEQIKEIVIALNLIGVKTCGSCEGHFDHGLPYPWVAIKPYNPEEEDLCKENETVWEKIELEELALQTKFPDLSINAICKLPEAENLRTLYDKRCQLEQARSQNEAQCLEPMNRLLDLFYENRKTSYDNQLIIPPSCAGYLHSVGGDRQLLRSQEEQSVHLHEYQEEMKAFAAFLKETFMQATP